MSSSVERLAQISSQMSGTESEQARAAILTKKDDDVVITFATRTALTKARKGYLKDTPLEGLIVPLLERVRTESGIEPSLVEEIVVGNVLHKDASFVTRASAVAAGYPASTVTSTVSRWCSSGLLAIEAVAHKISSRSIDIGIAMGAESMSNNPDNGAPAFPSHFLNNPIIRDISQPMPWTAENVARCFSISREAQDEYAAISQQKAEASRKAGFSADEITPINTSWKDSKTGKIHEVVAIEDDGIRPGTTKERLSKITAAFPQWLPATTTGGNTSQITDGAAAILLMRRSIARKLNVPVLGKFVLSTVAGVDPSVMGIGPAVAIPKLLSKLRLDKGRIDIFEINEAFASMLVYCTEKLDLDPARLNPRGGAIALGHPLGCTGVRQVVTALSELKRTGGKIAITSMCIGTGMGMASLIVSEQSAT